MWKALSFLQKNLVWTIPAMMVLGLVVGSAVDAAGLKAAIIPLTFLMVYPMMVGVDFGAVAGVARQPRGLLVTLVVNWLIKPFTMALIAVLFFDFIFAPWIAPEDAAQYTAGLILLGAAPCTAMVFIWSQLTRGDATYTLVQVSVNDLIMVVAFAPIVAFLLGVTDISVPWETLVLATVLYVVLPLVAGLWIGFRNLRPATPIEEAVRADLRRIAPPAAAAAGAVAAETVGAGEGKLAARRARLARLGGGR